MRKVAQTVMQDGARRADAEGSRAVEGMDKEQELFCLGAYVLNTGVLQCVKWHRQ